MSPDAVSVSESSTLFARPPQAQESEVAKEFLGGDGKREEKWQAYCQVLLCANEFMYVD